MPEDLAEYLSIASRVANARMRGRTGFGGLSRRPQVLANSLRLMLRSQFSRARPLLPLGRRWHFDPDEYHYYLALEGGSPYSLFTDFAASPAAFDPQPIWALRGIPFAQVPSASTARTPRPVPRTMRANGVGSVRTACSIKRWNSSPRALDVRRLNRNVYSSR